MESAVVSLIDLISEKISKIYIYDEKIIPNTLTGVNKKIWDKLLIKQNISFIKDMDTFIKKVNIVFDSWEPKKLNEYIL